MKNLWRLFLGGLFGLMFAANAGLVYFATNSSRGFIEERPYRSGLVFEEKLQKMRLAQSKQLGFSVLPQGDTEEREYTIRVASQKAVDLKSLRLTALRPNDKNLDFQVQLTTASQALSRLQRGSWIMQLEGYADDQLFFMEEKVFLP